MSVRIKVRVRVSVWITVWVGVRVRVWFWVRVTFEVMLTPSTHTLSIELSAVKMHVTISEEVSKGGEG